MARVGPNQDINDANVLIELLLAYQTKSELIGNLLAQYLSEDINAEGPPIADISIPRKLFDGSTQLLEGSDAKLFSQDEISNALSNSVLVTYVDLAERFRDYFEVFRDTLLSISDTENRTEEIIPSVPGEEPFPGSYPTTLLGSEGGIETQIQTIHFTISAPNIPVWSGSGPTNYNSGTYPQLSKINDATNGGSEQSDETTREEYTWRTIEGARRLTGGDFTMFTQCRYATIEIPNFDNFPRIVQITANATSSRTADEVPVGLHIANEFAQISLIYGIGNFGESPVPVDEIIFIEDPNSHNGGIHVPLELNLSASLDESIEIPPNKSLFFGVAARANASFNNFANSNIVFEGNTVVSVVGGNVTVSDILASTSYSGPGI